ncbi:Galactose-1-phosphate uridylyltransferase [Maioricimonas rarisocia]|uniref:Galactose-1-phosphate uridylyltransferase n=1 Tax=Maioricimonas rarisocia TaxID=2528026 RepID=A0A517ZD20_9PLAN|nr:galactose-1-phosphate uridylyltransferase [Maioricimonas rarisocia]QDU40340.1 Galactose-1-phosphate uridylyltransferase [Maioricimonas rarisocia]
MSEMRYDHTTGDWVVFAPLRKLRPHAETSPASSPPTEQTRMSCPFCPGNESMTPPEIAAIRPDGRGDSEWLVRVIPNKFPALRIEEDDRRRQQGRLFQHMGGCGAHEVIIESPDHSLLLCQQPVEQIERILRMAQSRFNDLMQDHRFQSIIVFKNHGEGAGTSLRHPHWQIIATPVVPRMLRQRYEQATEHFDRTGNCLYCELVNEELAADERIILTNAHYVAFMPYASHLPFETWIVPLRQQATFGQVPAGELPALAGILREVLLKLYVALDNPDFNLTIDVAPRGDEDKEYYQWHIRVLPRLSTTAGFEMGSGMSINTVLPEEAARFLRNGRSSTGT